MAAEVVIAEFMTRIDPLRHEQYPDGARGATASEADAGVPAPSKALAAAPWPGARRSTEPRHKTHSSRASVSITFRHSG